MDQADSLDPDSLKSDKCPKCGGLFEFDEAKREGQKLILISKCLSCGKRTYKSLAILRDRPTRTASHTRRSLLPSAQDEFATQCTRAAHHFRLAAEMARLRSLSSNPTQEQRVFEMQVRYLEGLAAVSNALRDRWVQVTWWCDAVIQQATKRFPKSHDAVYDQLAGEYGRLMLGAEKYGLGTDPLVQEWFAMRRHMGDKDYLRGARRGLEKGVKRPYGSPTEMELDLEIMRLHLAGKTLRQIGRILSNKSLLPPGKTMSHVAVSKRIKALQDELPWFRDACRLTI